MTELSPNLPPRQWIAGIRETNSSPLIGFESLSIESEAAITRKDVVAFLNWLAKLAEADLQCDQPLDMEVVSGVAESDVQWVRARYRLYPLYLQSLVITLASVDSGNELPPGLSLEKPTRWVLSHEIFRSGSLAYTRNADAWRRFLLEILANSDASGGLAFNLLEIPASALEKSQLDIRPVVLHALSTDGTACDRGDCRAQAAIANAFWQTFWATGALRTQRGRTFPVAFYPIDRSWPGEFEGLWHSRWVSLRRRLFGRTSLMAYMSEALTAAKALWFDTETQRFVADATFQPELSGLTWEDYRLYLFELNRTGFVDAYIGENANIFSKWKTEEKNSYSPRSSWDEERATQAIYDASSPFVVSDPASCGSLVRIHRVVPYAGCAFLSEVVNETDRLSDSGKLRELDGLIVGATNSTFFLNFPEEYVTLHSAMNDPVAALVENSHCHQIRTLRRAAFVLTSEGKPIITTALGLKLDCFALVFEGESVAATYFDRAHRPFPENKIGPLNFGAVVVGNAIVEIFEDMCAEVPANGWVIGDSEAFDHRIDPRQAASVELRDPETNRPVPIRHAFAVGPLLVSDGQVVPLGESKEEFAPIVTKEAPDFEEAAQLPRSALPKALREAPMRGVPPTRFPYDWDKTRAPRTAIGIREDGTVLLVVVDGRARPPHSVGATLAELAILMKNLGCRHAMNMDGGGSSVMFVNDVRAASHQLSPDLKPGVVNLPSDLGGVERLLPVPLLVIKRQ
jgi:hypothetical protein